MPMRTARGCRRLCHTLVVGALLACGPATQNSPASGAATAQPPEPAQEEAAVPTEAVPALQRFGSISAPPRSQDDGSPDACVLLGDSNPGALLDAKLAPAERIYGLCWVQDASMPDPERSVGLEIRRDPAGVPGNLEQFWEREGGGVGMLGSSREQIQELGMLGDYALWFPVTGGMQLFTFWKNEYILVLTVRGVPTERALPWARELAGRSVQAAS